MYKRKKKNYKEVYLNITLIIATLLLLSFVDMIVLEKIYHPISKQHSISWEEFETQISALSFFGKNPSMLWWHVAFAPLGYFIFVLLGVAAKSWRLVVSGIFMFITGWEDIFYYLIQLRGLPLEFSWLDSTIFMGFTKYLTGTAHVTNVGIIISAFIGMIISGFILFEYNPLRLLKIGHSKNQEIQTTK